MQRFSRQWLRGGAGMALLAMLAVLTSPALALACCCGQESTAIQALQPQALPVATASHPGCHGHAEADKAGAPDVATSRVSASSRLQTSSIAASAPSEGPCFQSLCECGHASVNALRFVEAQNTSSFSPLVVGVAVGAFSPAAVVPSLTRCAFASNAAKPRSPDTHSRSGRAPPAFSPS